MVLLSSSISLLISALLFYQLLREGFEVSKYNCGYVYFSFHLYPFLLHIFFSSIVWDLDI